MAAYQVLDALSRGEEGGTVLLEVSEGGGEEGEKPTEEAERVLLCKHLQEGGREEGREGGREEGLDARWRGSP